MRAPERCLGKASRLKAEPRDWCPLTRREGECGRKFCRCDALRPAVWCWNAWGSWLWRARWNREEGHVAPSASLPFPGCRPLSPKIQVISNHCQGRVKTPARERKERWSYPSQGGTQRETSDHGSYGKVTEEFSVDSAKRPEGATWDSRIYREWLTVPSGEFGITDVQAFKESNIGCGCVLPRPAEGVRF